MRELVTDRTFIVLTLLTKEDEYQINHVFCFPLSSVLLKPVTTYSGVLWPASLITLPWHQFSFLELLSNLKTRQNINPIT